jgi:hypothetical protein
MQDAMTQLAGWETFYVIIGGGAAALTGLQFVVIALVAERRPRTTQGQIDAFGTPTIVHFCTVLLISATLVAPWEALNGPTSVLLVVGASGLVYVGLVTRRARRQAGYKPVLEDWVWHVALPFVSYGSIFISAFILVAHEVFSLFIVGATALLLLFIGIHNAWDSVTFITLGEAETGN